MTYLILILAMLIPACITGSQGTVTQANTTLKVLQINLCADWKDSRQARADKIIELVRAEHIDLICFQEGIKGVGQFNAGKYIADQLGYSYSQVPAFGFPGFYEFSVGVISAGPLVDSKAIGCQVSGGDALDKIPFPGAARGLLVNSQGVNVMSSHLTVPVAQDQRAEQVQCLMNALPPGIRIWAGDFNMNRSNPAYPLIKMQEAVLNPPQVDMIFYTGLSLLGSRYVFTDHFVSDHFGVLAEFGR